MSRLVATLQRARDLYLEKSFRFLDWTDWIELLKAAAGGDEELAGDALEFLDVVSPGDGAAIIRTGEQRMKELGQLAVERGLMEPEEPSPRLYNAGSAFSFWERGDTFREDGGLNHSVAPRKPLEVAAIIGKACVLAQAQSVLRRRPQPVSRAPERAPAPAQPPVRARRYDDFVAEPEENEGDDA